METKNWLQELIQSLPKDIKAEVYDFVRFLFHRKTREEAHGGIVFLAPGVTRV